MQEPHHDAPVADEPTGGEPACFLDRVRDCCGTVEGEPHHPTCPEAQSR